MAMSYIVNHNENIYSVEEKEMAQMKKVPRYHSKFAPQVIIECKLGRFQRRTMGNAIEPPPNPKNYLRAGSGIHPPRPVVTHKCNHPGIAPIPKRSQSAANPNKTDDCCNCPDSGSGKNKGIFIKKNIDTVVNAKPRRPYPKYVDTKGGDTHDLCNSGLIPMYIYQTKFGKLPKYLSKRIRDAAMQEEMLRAEQLRKQPLCRYITQEERGEILNGLKHNWAEMQAIYQGLPVLTDTIPKANRKTKLENELRQLEKDIVLVESNPYIYVYK